MQGGQPLSDKVKEEMIRYLQGINLTNRVICRGMAMAIEHANSSRDISEIITQSLLSLVKRCTKEHQIDVK